jgi:hypothetical protein
MDWDDEDEKTTVYEKGGQEDAAKALLRSAPPPAAGAPAPREREDRVAAAAAALSPAQIAAMQRTEPPQHRREQGSGGMIALIIAALLLVAAAAAGFVIYKPFAKSSLLVTVAGPNNRAVDAVEVIIENEAGAVAKRCETTPCRLIEASPGPYVVKVKAGGYATPAPDVIKLERGEDRVVKVNLAQATRGTGLRITAIGAGLMLSVNGKDEGPLPVKLDSLEPGEYTLAISDEKGRYEKWEKVVRVEQDRILNFDLKLRVLKGLARVRPGKNADGAKVMLVSGKERRILPELPKAIEITPDKSYTLVATKAGFEDYSAEISFADGIAEKDFEVTLLEKGAKPAPAAPEPPPAPAVAARPAAPAKPSPAAPAEPAPAPATPAAPAGDAVGGQGTIVLNSVPASAAIVNGKPVGQTPTSWKGPPGSYTVVFVHPEFGRKMQSVTVKPGGTTSASVRFP